MRNTHRKLGLGRMFAAALVAGSLTFGGSTVGVDVMGTEGVALAGDTYKPRVDKGDDGEWVAYVECCGGFASVEVGRYETRKEARKAAKEAADEWNGVMDGPGCDPPFVLC